MQVAAGDKRMLAATCGPPGKQTMACCSCFACSTPRLPGVWDFVGAATSRRLHGPLSCCRLVTSPGRVLHRVHGLVGIVLRLLVLRRRRGIGRSPCLGGSSAGFSFASRLGVGLGTTAADCMWTFAALGGSAGGAGVSPFPAWTGTTASSSQSDSSPFSSSSSSSSTAIGTVFSTRGSAEAVAGAGALTL